MTTVCILINYVLLPAILLVLDLLQRYLSLVIQVSGMYIQLAMKQPILFQIALVAIWKLAQTRNVDPIHFLSVKISSIFNIPAVGQASQRLPQDLLRYLICFDIMS